MDEEIDQFKRNSVTSSRASLKVRPSDNLMMENERQSTMNSKGKKGIKLVRSFGNIDEDDIEQEESANMNFEEKDDVSSSSSDDYMNSEEEMLDDRVRQAKNLIRALVFLIFINIGFSVFCLVV